MISRDPITGRRVCRPRQQSEWIQFQDESLRRFSQPIRHGLLDPLLGKKMATELHTEYSVRLKAAAQRHEDAPAVVEAKRKAARSAGASKVDIRVLLP